MTAAISASIQRGVLGARPGLGSGGGPAFTTVVSPWLTSTVGVGSVGGSGVGVYLGGLSIRRASLAGLPDVLQIAYRPVSGR
jgi:hypothetical protein